jgi:four helix bundle protein
MHNYKELKIWQKSREIVKEVYALTTKFPSKEQFGITSQLCRAVVSIPSNIAEGAGRESEKEFAHFLAIANGSAFEVETQLYLCFDLNYISEAELNDFLIKIQEIQRMIFRFKQQLKSS